MHVAVCLPAMDEVKTRFAMCLARMLYTTALLGEQSGIKSFSLHSHQSSILPLSRQHLVDLALEAGCSHMLMVDSDMTFPGDALVRMVAADKDIIGVNVCARKPPYHLTAESAPGVKLVPKGEGLEEVYRVGTGIILVKRRVLEKMKLPHFAFEWVFKRGKKPDLRGEDYFFCQKARRRGFSIWVDHGLSREVGHLGEFEYTIPLMEATQGEK